MTSAASNPNQANQPTLQINNTTSPPSKRDLKSWWKGFKLPSKHQEPQETRPQGIFGVPLRQSITYANVAISLIDEKGQSYIYGYVPIVVAKCGVFLKEKATHIEGIFRLSGSEKRIKELKTIFDSPDRYGKGLVWDGYTVHDAANVLRRYLNDLPEPVVPLDLYEKFRDPLRGATKQAVGDAEGPQFVENFNEKAAIIKYQRLITELPPLNRQLLLYILDLLAVFAAKADENRMNSQNLAAIFQPGMLSHPAHAMAPEEYRLNQCVIIFLIENQDHFLIGMQGTAADEKTKKEVESGTPSAPLTPLPTRQTSLGRSASNASAGANSVRRDGKLRRNRSVSSRNSRNDGSSTPNSPALTATPTTGGLARSNTVPSKKSPAIGAGRFQRPDASSPRSPAHLEPLTQVSAAAESVEQSPQSTRSSDFASGGYLTPTKAPATGRSHERLLEVPQESSTSTPSKERNLPSIFRGLPNTDTGDKRQPNKLKKKRIPGSLNPSAQSSAASLNYHQNAASTSPGFELPNPMEHPHHYEPEPQVLHQQPAPIQEERHRELLEQQPQDRPQGQAPQDTQLTPPASLTQLKSDVSSEHTPRASQASSNQSLHPDNTLKSKKSPPTSLHSSFNEGSDLDQILDEQSVSTVDQAEKERKRRWRLSRSKNADNGAAAGLTSPRLTLGQNDNGDVSNLSISSSSHRPRKSESSDRPYTMGEAHGSFDQGREGDSKGPIGWIRSKYREAKESAEQRRNKSPPPPDHPVLGASSFSPRGKSLEIRRDAPREAERHPNTHAQHASLAAVAGVPAVASTAATAAGPTMAPAPTGAPVPQMATVAMVQPEQKSPVQQTHAQAQPPAQAQVQPSVQAQAQSPVQPQPQSPLQLQTSVQPQTLTQTQAQPKAQAELQKSPVSPRPVQKIISMLDVDTVPAKSPVSSPVHASAPAAAPAAALITTQPQELPQEQQQTQEQPQSELPQEPKQEEKLVQAPEQLPATSPVQQDRTQAEQHQPQPELEPAKQEQ
ncbi:GTPase activating protein (GAP) for Rho1p [Fusarium torreyae]|uniref:GTPase activating protein (GAP) for Rho1p n=1 Tax=Fusarium torreyae TaxID=1237075 RepID=A0A9W8S3R5_9HYPO|nr:GTPase activating protein (GAP) for Rho1p [Fusarium torreyae]